MPKLLKDIAIHEVSAVDRGAGEGVRVLLMKRDFSAKERQRSADRGHALPDGSFPIENKGDLKNAIGLVGHAKDPAKAKAHIKARARALGATDMLPEDWGKREENDDMPLDKKHEDFIAGLVAKHEKKLAKKAQRAEVEKAMLPSEKAFYETLGKADAKAFRKMTAAERAAVIKAGKVPPKKKPAAQDDDGDDDDVGKRIETVANDTLAKALASNAAMQKRIDALEYDSNLTIAKRDAVEMGMGEDFGETLLKARGGDKAAIAKMEDALKTLRTQRDEAARTGKVFSEFGKAGSGVKKTAYDELSALADDLRKREPKLSQAQAFDKVYNDPANAELAKRERDERMAKINRVA